MRYTMTFLEDTYNKLVDTLLDNENEKVAFLLCGLSKTDDESRFLVNEVFQISEEHVAESNSISIKYKYNAYLPVINAARQKDKCFFIVHSHKDGNVEFSELDNSEEVKLLSSVYNIIDNKLHGSIVFSDKNCFNARVLNIDTGEFESIDMIRVLGTKYVFLENSILKKTTVNKILFDRTIEAFGIGLQEVLSKMHIGVVGCGGTGSAVVEQLARMGVAEITVVDFDKLEDTNLTRVHGSKYNQIGNSKVSIMNEMINEIKLGTNCNMVNERLGNEKSIKSLRNCDLIFSCLDNTYFARAILSYLTTYYYIPVIDTGIRFYSTDGILNDIFARVNVVTPNTPCLFCTNIVTPQHISAEFMNPEEYENLRKEGYVPELEKGTAQVIPINTVVASIAVMELIQLVTNFKGADVIEPKKIFSFVRDKYMRPFDSEKRKNDACKCKDADAIGAGDINPFLGVCWG